ncbi:MAG TPA: ParB N-terminal domain-containing protein [Desulfobacterales bacterium]
MENQKVEISRIVVNDSVQQRVQVDEKVVEDYFDEIDAGAQFPPLVVFDDGQDLILADGRHRYEAFRLAEVETVDVEVREGTVRDAILYAVGANADHGLRRTNADKRMAVETLLKDQEWARWSDGEIARRARVSQAFVSSVRRDLTQNGFEFPTERIGRNGRTMDTSNIGSRNPAPGSDQGDSDEGSQVDDDSNAGDSEDSDSQSDDDSTESSANDDQGDADPAEGEKDSPQAEGDGDPSVDDQSNESAEEPPAGPVSEDEPEEDPAKVPDKVNEEDVKTEKEPLTDDVAALHSRIRELEEVIKQKDEELRLKDERIAELEKQVAELRDDVQYYEAEIKDSIRDGMGQASGRAERNGYQPVLN